MASATTSTPSTNIDPKKDASKGPQQANGLVTPEQTPEPEDARAAADKARREKEVEDEIKRINNSNSAASTLGVGENSSPEDRIRAWQALGCKIHPEYCGYWTQAKSNEEKRVYTEENKKAFHKLAEAAKELGVEEQWIGEVETWKGEDDLTKGSLNDESDTESEDESNPADRMIQDSIPVPPERVREIYEDATPHVQKLAIEPNNKDAHDALMKSNIAILQGNKAHNQSHSKEERIKKKTWEIPIRFFQEHLARAKDNFDIVVKDPLNDTARAIAEQEKTIISDMVLQNHFPELWNMNGIQLPAKPQGSGPTEGSTMNYPWATLSTDHGLIVGVRERKIGGTLVCIETKEGIRRLESAEDIGQTKVDEYMKMPNYKSLSNANIKLYRKDEARLKQLHWVTMSVILNKNTAKGKMDPPTYCCVELDSGLEILTVSNVCNALGRKNGRAAIERVCEGHGIPAPWNRMPQYTYHKPGKDGPKKTLAEKWVEVDSLVSPANGTSVNNPVSNNGGGSTDPRVDLMSAKLDSLEKTVAALLSAIQKLTAGGSAESSLFVTS